jgi:vancomycin resistance protein YoaR
MEIGLDAAVNWATKTDFKFRNNFHFPIQIRAKLEDGYMKMQIVGVDEKDYYIEMRSGRSDEELRIYSNSYKYKYSKETGELISKDLEARSAYMYFTS